MMRFTLSLSLPLHLVPRPFRVGGSLTVLVIFNVLHAHFPRVLPLGVFVGCVQVVHVPLLGVIDSPVAVSVVEFLHGLLVRLQSLTLLLVHSSFCGMREGV